MKFYYFDKIPISEVRPGSLPISDPRLKDPNWFKPKFKDWKRQYKKCILKDIKKNGQLNPNVVLWDGRTWRVEPGQSRWMAMYKLNIPIQKIIAIVTEDSEKYFYLISNYVHKEIKNRTDLENCFLDTKWEDHHGLGFFRRQYAEYFDIQGDLVNE